jgi:outer membrane protein TolC
LAGMTMALSGCASYAAKPLSERTDLAPSLNRLELADPNTAARAESGLDLEELAALAVRNNPDLKAKRERLGVANAQLYAAGLLPDPQLSTNLDSPTCASTGLVTAYGVALGYDIVPLVTRGARVQSERQAAAQVDLGLLWEEWQVSQQARTMAVRWASERAQLALLEQMRDLYRKRYRFSAEALRQGNLTVDVAGTDLTALLDTLSRLNQLEQSHNETENALHLLLGLAPQAPLAVEVPPPPPPEAPGALQKLLPSLPERRPDLLALQAGYRSQEAKVRAAILSQFPSFSIGINRARDTGSVYTSGFNVGLNLPLFSGNRGAIAIERATRKQLHTEYQARLDQAVVDIDKLTRLQGIVAAQQRRLDEYLPTLGRMVEQTRKASLRQDIDALTFLNMETTWIGKRLERIQLDQSLWESHVALQTLLAVPPRLAASGFPSAATRHIAGKNKR